MRYLKDIKNAINHLKSHQTFPATKQELVETCNNLSDFSADDKKWFAKNIPDKTYNSVEEVMNTLGWTDKTIHAM